MELDGIKIEARRWGGYQLWKESSDNTRCLNRNRGSFVLMNGSSRSAKAEPASFGSLEQSWKQPLVGSIPDGLSSVARNQSGNISAQSVSIA